MVRGWRGRGGGGGRWSGAWPGRGPFSHLPPWQKPGWMLGMGAGYGGWSRGYPTSPWVFARFPWLLRWCWARPGSPEEELAAIEDYKKMLEEERAGLEREISDVEARIRELRSMLGRG